LIVFDANKVKAILVTAVLVLGVLAFGYWHATTHSSLYVSLNIAAEADRKALPTLDAEVQFLDSSGNVLANGVRDKQYNFVNLINPAYGDCREVEKAAAFSQQARASWHECFERQSTWIATWIGDVAAVNVKYENCLIKNSPIAISRSSANWYLWWVPHPHIGGKPYSDYSATIVVDAKDCVKNPL